MGKHEKERDGFKSRTGFILACIGSAVGMGNIWRFPYMVSDWGGMTFLIPYILFVILIASTGVIEEMALGRAAKGGPIKAFGVCTEMRTGNKKTGELIGLLPVLGSLALAIGYTVVVGWIFKYTFLALTGQIAGMKQDMNQIGGMFDSTASAFGNNLWLVIAVLVTAVIMAMCQRRNDAVIVRTVSWTRGIYFLPSWFIDRISLHLHDQSKGTFRPKTLDLCFWAGILLSVHCRKWNCHLWFLLKGF